MSGIDNMWIGRLLSLFCLIQVASGVAATRDVVPRDVTPAVATGSIDHALAGPDSSTAHLTADDVNAWLDGYLPYALKSGDIAGAMVVVVKDGEILTERGYGFADMERGIRVDPQRTLFRPGSVAKLFTWTAVMQQVELGKIDLDQDINRYLDFTLPGKPITLRNLMQHTPGYEDYDKDGISDDPKRALSYESWLKQWIPAQIFAPGTTPAYSNYGASLAGYIVQRVSGESFDSYVERHIFAPLGMMHSTFRQPLPKDLAPWMSCGYDVASQKARRFELVGPAPAGSMSATGEDMAHFMIAHLQEGEYHGQRILQTTTARAMHNSPLTLLPPLDRMELGFFETNINGREVIAHLGDTAYFHSALHLFLKDNVGLYFSFNSLGRDAAAAYLRDALFEAFANRYLPGSRVTTPINAKTAAEHARMLAGRWILSRRSESSFLSVVQLLSQVKVGVGQQGDIQLPFKGLNGQPRRWIETAPFVWQDPDSRQRLAAQVIDGQAVRFSLDGFAPFMVLERVPWYKNSAWLMPSMVLGLVALALTLVLWPIRAVVRRQFHATLDLDARSLRVYRLSRLAAGAVLVVVLGWAGVIALLFSGLEHQNSSLNPVLRSIEILAAVGLSGGLAVLLWYVRSAWTWRMGWPAKLWSLVLALSAAIIVVIALEFHLLSFGVNY